jgi:predicted ArsR family transcriptional regulator
MSVRKQQWNLDELIIEALAEGPATVAAIAYDTGYSETAVRRHLEALEEEARVIRDGHLWEANDDVEVVA